MSRKYVAPEVAESYSCPHCGTLSHQFWYRTYISRYDKGSLPFGEIREDYVSCVNSDDEKSPEEKLKTIEFLSKVASKEPFVDVSQRLGGARLYNIDFVSCFSCEKFTIWNSGKVIYPQFQYEFIPNRDMPNDIKSDYEEAAKILSISPRGSAALLRLCVQKLCKHLGEKGKNINEDIASLVRKGLDVRVQRSLDVVRVVGNDAVHPGQIDLKDDIATASQLFQLVNIITNTLITQPKEIDTLFDALPETKRKEITKRDA